mgnify:FL=1
MGECAARTARSVGFIERNLKNPVTIEDISRDAEYSPWHLQRLFREETGYAVKDYLRKRRLAAAARELAERDRNVLDVALDYGFGYEQSFIRAFEREFGVSPGVFRRKRISIGITPRIPPLRGDDTSQGTPSTRYQTHYYYRPERTIIGPRVYFRFRETEEDSYTIRVKNEFLRMTAGFELRGEELHSYVMLIPGNSEGAWFTLGYDAVLWKGPSRGYHETAIPGHIAASLDVPDAPPLCTLRVADVMAQYGRLRECGLGPFFRENDLFNYTVLTPEGISNKTSRFSVNIPVVELPE